MENRKKDRTVIRQVSQHPTGISEGKNRENGGEKQ